MCFRTIIAIAFLLMMALPDVLGQTYEYTYYTMANTPVLTTNSFKAAAVGKSGNIWIGSASQGLYRYNGSFWSKAPVLTTHHVRGMAISPVDSTLWVANTGTASGQYNNGGVHHILDTTTYAFTYYGAISGLPTRGGYGIAVGPDNIAWSAHIPQLTGSVVAGGGVGKMISGSSSAWSVYAGLPSGNFAEDARCLSIGRGSSELWVGVDRSCFNGTCKKAYIARYNLQGAFIDSIAASNSPIPFTNAVGGPVARAIDFDHTGRAWVGLSGGGLFVYDNGAWTQVNTGIFPSGAAVNVQSITHDDAGGMYIGTTAGIMIYYGGELTDPDNYSVFLPATNVTGVAIGTGAEIWLATTTGIVKMVQVNENSIEGYVFNTSLNYGAGSLIDEPFLACHVLLYDNGIPADSMYTSAAGYFKFASLDTTHTYNLVVKSMDLQSANIALKCTIPDADIGIPYTQIKLPYGLHADLVEHFEAMPHDTFDWSFLFGGLNLDKIVVDAYNESPFSQYEYSHRNFTISEDNPNEKETEEMARLLVQSHVLTEHKKYSANMTGIFTKEACDLGFILFDLVKNKGLVPVPPTTTYSKVALLLNAANRQFQSSIKRLINKACDYIDDEGIRTSTSQKLNAAYDAVSNVAEEYSTSPNFGSLTTVAAKELIGNTVANILTPGIFKFYYVDNTAQVLPQAISAIGSFPFTEDFAVVASRNIAVSNPSSKTNRTISAYNSTSADINLINTLSGISSAATNILEEGAMVTTLLCATGVGCAVAGALKTIAVSLRALNFAGKAVNVVKSGKFLYDTKTSTANSPDSIFDNAPTPVMQRFPVQTLAFQDRNNLYNQQISHIGTLLQAGKRDSVTAVISSFVQADSDVNTSMLDLSRNVFSVSPAACQDDPSFSDYLSETFINNSMTATMGRESFNYLLVSYLIDSVTNYADTLIAAIPGIILRNNRTVVMYDSIIAATASFPPSQPLFASIAYEQMCKTSSSYPVTVSVQNISNAGINGTWAVIEVNNGIVCETDSVFIGMIPAGHVETATFYITTPPGDTSAQFFVTVRSPDGAGDADGGSLSISGMALVSNIYNKTVAAGESACFNASQTVIIAGNNTTCVIGNGGIANVIAGNNIIFKGGTKVLPGGYLHGTITTDNKYCNSIVPSVLVVPTAIIAGGQAGCYNATQTLTVAGGTKTFTIQSGGNVTLVAGQKISMLSGLRVMHGGNLKGYITTDDQYCPAPLPGNLSISATNITHDQVSCFDATRKITVGGNNAAFTVQSGGKATMIAGLQINYLPGTKVYTGGEMHGYITTNGQYCGAKDAEIISEGDDMDPPPVPRSGYKVYPNPTNGMFILESTAGSDNMQVTVEIFGMRGDRQFSKKFDRAVRYEFSLSGKPSGLYFLRVTDENKSEIIKVIKQ